MTAEWICEHTDAISDLPCLGQSIMPIQSSSFCGAPDVLGSSLRGAADSTWRAALVEGSAIKQIAPHEPSSAFGHGLGLRA